MYPLRSATWVAGAMKPAVLALWSLLVLMSPPVALAGQEAGEAPPAEDQAPARLFEQEPYDELILNDEARTVVRVLPLDLPARRLPDPLPKLSAKLVVRKVDDPVTDFEILWRDIAEVKLFEQMVLAEANSLVNDQKFDEAYDYFEFLQRVYPQTSGLEAALENYWYLDAGEWQKKEGYENALASLNALYDVHPERANLDVALGMATEKLIGEYLAGGDYASARRLLGNLAAKFPEHATVATWEAQWTSEANEILALARAQFDAGQLREAQELGMQALAIWPAHAAARQLAEEVYRRHPRVIVGVTMPAGDAGASPIVDWAARRTSRLVHRLLLEFTGVGPEGGEYLCPLGSFEKEDVGRRLLFRLNRGIGWSAGDQRLTGFDVARRLLVLADPSHPDVQPDWAELFQAVDVRDVYEVEVELRWSHVRPDALLQTPLLLSYRPTGPAEAAGTIGPYSMLERTPDRVRYLANDGYFAQEPAQPKEIVERYYRDTRTALAALRKGEIRVLDRINPWDVARLQAESDLVVEAYALPTLHCLLPNLARPFTSQPDFRRALVYGIDRARILQRHVLRDREVAGCQVVSGPFPAGASLDDPLRYAYNSRVEPRPWDPHLAMALAGAAVDVPAAARKKGHPEVLEIPPLVLAHPPHEIARAACQAIQKYLAAVKIPVTLRELEPGWALPADADYDLVYAEICLQEPVVQARRLLGEDGLVGGSSPWMSLALRRLDVARGWNEARERLQTIHQIAHEDVAVIPLWQLTEHFVYHKSLEGVGARPVLLYQNVEQWQCTLQLPAEE